MESSDIKIFSGLSNVPLAEKIVKRLGKPLGSVEFKRFSDGEIWVKYGENIRGSDVYIVQSTNPPAENILELLIMIDALLAASIILSNSRIFSAGILEVRMSISSNLLILLQKISWNYL